MQVLTVTLIYVCLIVFYFMLKKIQDNKRQRNVINFFLYYNRRKSNITNRTKKTGDIIYLIPPTSNRETIFSNRNEDID